MEYPISARIYDSKVRQQIGGPENYNLKHSYIKVPYTAQRNVWAFYKSFNVLVKTDSLTLGLWYDTPDSLGCQDDPYVYGGLLSSTYFKIKLENIYEHLLGDPPHSLLFRNLNVQSSVYLGNGYDRTEMEFNRNSFNQLLCMSLNANWNTPYINLIFTFKFRNLWYVNVNEYERQATIFINDGVLTVDQFTPPYYLYTFNQAGQLLFKDQNLYNTKYNKNLSLSANKIYFIQIKNKDRQDVFTKKIFSR